MTLLTDHPVTTETFAAMTFADTPEPDPIAEQIAALKDEIDMARAVLAIIVGVIPEALAERPPLPTVGPDSGPLLAALVECASGLRQQLSGVAAIADPDLLESTTSAQGPADTSDSRAAALIDKFRTALPEIAATGVCETHTDQLAELLILAADQYDRLLALAPHAWAWGTAASRMAKQMSALATLTQSAYADERDPQGEAFDAIYHLLDGRSSGLDLWGLIDAALGGEAKPEVLNQLNQLSQLANYFPKETHP